jgi:hypothetical protein
MDSNAMKRKYDDYLEAFDHVPANEWEVINKHYMTVESKHEELEDAETVANELPAGNEKF